MIMFNGKMKNTWGLIFSVQITPVKNSELYKKNMMGNITPYSSQFSKCQYTLHYLDVQQNYAPHLCSLQQYA